MNKKRILIVEDEKALSHSLKLKLDFEGFETVIADNGVQALNLLEKEHFDLLLLDLILPAVDGFRILEQLHTKPNKPPVFVLSNLSQPEDAQRVMKLGAAKYMVKSDNSLGSITQAIINFLQP